MTDQGQWYAGVDWASESHHVFLTDGNGRKIGEKVFKHGGEGLAAMAAWLTAASGAVGEQQIQVAIEVPHGPVVETLIERGFKVNAINPTQMDRFRDRFTLSGAKDDSRDAEVMASALRTDPRCFRPLAFGNPVVIELREWSRIAEDLGAERNRLTNRMCEQLWRYFPAILELEADLGAEWLPICGRPRRRRPRPPICVRRRSPNCSSAIVSAASTQATCSPSCASRP
ncbi:IS110 family transposase [Mesorhizobium sp. A556]